MRLDDDELLDSLMTFDMREVHHEDRPMRGTREYLVRVVLRLLAGDVQHGVYKFDFDKLSDENEEAIHAVCDGHRLRLHLLAHIEYISRNQRFYRFLPCSRQERV